MTLEIRMRKVETGWEVDDRLSSIGLALPPILNA